VITSKKTSTRVPQNKSISESYATRPEQRQKLKESFIRAMGSKLITKHLYQKEAPTPRRTYEWWLMVLMNPSRGTPKAQW
jgi:hypothetical protein